MSFESLNTHLQANCSFQLSKGLYLQSISSFTLLISFKIPRVNAVVRPKAHPVLIIYLKLDFTLQNKFSYHLQGAQRNKFYLRWFEEYSLNQ